MAEMEAVVIREPGDPEVLQLETVTRPEPEGREVLVEVGACGVCYHEIVVRQGVLRRGVEIPLIPGHEVAGRVAAVGEGVTEFAAGDRVCATAYKHVCGRCRYCRSGRENLCPRKEFLGDAGLNGGYAEAVLIEADNLVPLPNEVSFTDGALLGCGIGTVFNAVRDIGRVRPGDWVLVNGASGGIGIHAIQIASLCGGRVIAETTSSGQEERLRDLGADHVVVAERGEDFGRRVREITGGPGVDVAVDCVGSPTFHAVRHSLAVGARWIFIGQVNSDFVELNPAQIFLRSIDILSTDTAAAHQVADLARLVGRGEVRPVVSEVLPLADAARAHRQMETGESTGRLVLRP